MASTTSFVNRLRNDTEFRRRFVAAPKQVLSEAGLDPDALALPDRIDEQALVEKLDRVFSGREWQDAFARAKPETLTPKELWDRFGVIGWQDFASSGQDSRSSAVTSVAVAVVIYGVSMVTSTTAQVVVAVEGRASLPLASVEQVKALRELSRIPKESLKFGIVGPDGTGIDGVNADLLAAFLARVKSMDEGR